MGNYSTADDPLRVRLKHFVVDRLKPRHVRAEMIADEEPLIGGRMGLDSLDALQLFVALEEEFGVTIEGHEESRAASVNIAKLAEFIRNRQRTDSVIRSSLRSPNLMA